MPYLYDRVRETTTSLGTATVSLGGAVNGFRTFSSVLSNAQTCHYVIENSSAGEWECGVGTYNTSGNTLSRTTIKSSSNSNAVVSLSAGTKYVSIDATAFALGGAVSPGTCEGRLTLTSGSPVPSTDVSAGTTLYFTPYTGSLISLYDGTSWGARTFTEISASISSLTTGPAARTGNVTIGSATVSNLSATSDLYVGMPITGTAFASGTYITSIVNSSSITVSNNSGTTATGQTFTFYYGNYDIFVYDNAGTLTLEATGWSANSATPPATPRATNITLQDGVYVKSGATTRRYLGSIHVLTSTTMADSLTKRHLWNYYNRVPRTVQVRDTSGSWSYAGSATWRAFNGNAANNISIMSGSLEESYLELVMGHFSSCSSGVSYAAGLCVNATNAASAWGYGSYNVTDLVGRTVFLNGPQALGWHTYFMVEFSQGGTATVYGGGSDGEAGFTRGFWMG